VLKFTLRLPQDIAEQLRAWAVEENRSLQQHIVWLLREALRQR
jgi:hypothetical protein